MRGTEKNQHSLFSYISPQQRVPKDHPLRPIRKMVDKALKEMHDLFAEQYSQTGRPSIPPEQLLRCLLLQVFYIIRSERLLMEQLDYNLLFRWFVGLSIDDAVWDHSTFSKNREREAAVMMIDQVPGKRRITVGADKGYDCKEFVDDCRQLNATAHVAQKEKNTAIDARTTRHQGYDVSLRVRKRVEEVFGWLKTIGCLRKLHHRGSDRVDTVFTLATAAYNLIRIRNLTAPGYT